MAPRHNSGNTEQYNREWREATEQTLARLDILAEYTKFGFTFERPRPTSSGWVQSTNDPSFGVNVGTGKSRGRFKDFGKGNEPGASIFDYAVLRGLVSSIGQAKIHYMKLAGVPVPGGNRDANFDDRPVPSLTQTPKTPKPKKVHDYTQIMELMFAHAKLRGDHARLAESIKVGAFALVKMCVGTWGDQNDQSYGIYWGNIDCTMWPEFHWTGKRLIPVSFMRRAWESGLGRDGKRVIAGGIRGIYVPTGWIGRANRTGWLPVHEGGSDTAGGCTIGLGSIGYPTSASEEVRHHLIPMVKAALRSGKLRSDIKIVVTRDQNNGGELDTGAISVCQWIADGLATPVWLRHIPFGSGYFKDVRAWVGHMLDKPHEISDGSADYLGPVFLDHIVGYPAIRDPAKWCSRPKSTEVVTSATVTTETVEGCPEQDRTIRITSLPNTEGSNTDRPVSDICHSDDPEPDSPYYHNEDRPSERLRRETLALNPDPERYPIQSGRQWYSLDGTCSTPGEPNLQDAARLSQGLSPTSPSKPPKPVKPSWDTTLLDRLESVRYAADCPRVGPRTHGHRELPLAKRRIVRCRNWKCPECQPGERCDWALHAHRIFRETQEELFVWRGSEASFMGNGRKRVNEARGQFIRVCLGDGNALVVTTVQIRDSVPITDQEAHRQVIAAIAEYTRPPGGEADGCQPVRSSTCGPWKKINRGSTGQWYDLTAKDENHDETLQYLARFGITRDLSAGGGDVLYHLPTTWDSDTRSYICDFTEDDTRNSFTWARGRVFPEFWRKGDIVPDPRCFIADLEDREPYHFDPGLVELPVKPTAAPAPAADPETAPEPESPTPALFDDAV